MQFDKNELTLFYNQGRFLIHRQWSGYTAASSNYDSIDHYPEIAIVMTFLHCTTKAMYWVPETLKFNKTSNTI